MTNDEVKSTRKQIESLETSIHELENQIRTLKGELREHNLEVANEKLNGIQPGDLVDVTTEYPVLPWVLGGEVKYQRETQRLFFKETTFEVWSDPSCLSNAQYEFFKVKKDGTPSKHTQRIYYANTVSIKKVTE